MWKKQMPAVGLSVLISGALGALMPTFANQNESPDSRLVVDALLARLDGGDRSPAVFRKLASPIHLEFSDEILARIAAEKERDPRNIAAAYCYYHVLELAGRPEKAVLAARDVYAAACGDRHETWCSTQDELFFSSFSLILEAEAQASADQFSAAHLTRIQGMWKDAIAISDRLGTDYSPPLSLTESIPLFIGIKPALLTRGSWLEALLRAGRRNEAAAVLRETDQLCPQYHDNEMCEQLRVGTEREFERIEARR